MQTSQQARKKEFVTGAGVTLTLSGLSPLFLERVKQSYEKQNPMPKKPTYRANLPGGDFEEHVHDEKTVEQGSDDVKAQWAKYQEDQRAWELGLNELVVRAMVLKGVSFEGEISPNDEWAIVQRALGIEIPTETVDLKIHYFETEVLSSADDLSNVLSEIMGLSGISQEQVKEAERLFRSQVQGE